MGTIGEAPEVSRGPNRNVLGIWMGGYIRGLIMVPDMDQLTSAGMDASRN